MLTRSSIFAIASSDGNSACSDAQGDRLVPPVAWSAVEVERHGAESGRTLEVAPLKRRHRDPVEEVSGSLVLAGGTKQLLGSLVLPFGQIAPSGHVEGRAANSQCTGAEAGFDLPARACEKRVDPLPRRQRVAGGEVKLEQPDQADPG
jgi:hypothetical protein